MIETKRASAEQKRKGVAMKRIFRGSKFASGMLCAIMTVAMFSSAVRAQGQQRPEEQTAGASSGPAKASGIVPPGVKLVPEMPTTVSSPLTRKKKSSGRSPCAKKPARTNSTPRRPPSGPTTSKRA